MHIRFHILLLTILLSSFVLSQDPCTCENDFTPVCGTNGFTYPNECIALCFGSQVDYEGECGSQSNCNPGEYTDIDGNCYPCEPGTYSVDGISCSLCQSGTASNGQMDCGNIPGYEGMLECGATECVECDMGTYAMGEGNSSCSVCEPGTFSGFGAFECDYCPSGTSSNGQMYCDMPGYEGMNECGATGCNECDAGTYAMGEGNSYCDVCLPGTFSGFGAFECDYCPSGTSSNGQMYCDMPGYEGMNECGATGCNECDAGTYAMGEGNSYCDYCQSGSYASSSGASECDVCPNNLYSNGQMDCWDGIPECGATECMDCNGQPWGDAIIDENGDCSESQSGCTYIEAYNFNPDAYLDDGTCLFPCQGDFNNDSNKDILDIIILVNEILDDVFCE